MQQSCPACGGVYESDVDICPIDGFELVDHDDADPLVGSVLDARFRIEEILGEGGMGQVYRARQLSVDRDVAIKVMRAEYSVDQQIRERFFREARVVSGLNHPNIVQLIDFGRDAESKRLYLAMEFLGGVGLRTLLERGTLRRDVTIAIISQALSGLAEAHANGIVHRDLKPDNLMVVANADGGFQLKVLDFGIAHSAASEKKLTTTGAVIGTPHYMAPEQARGRGVDHRTDIYAMGAIFYEMLSGRLAYSGESAMQILMKLATETPVHLESLTADDPMNRRLIPLVMSMIEREPAARPQSVTEVRRILSEIARDFAITNVVCAPERDDPFGVWFGEEPSMTPTHLDHGASKPVQSQEPLVEPETTDAPGHETKGELVEFGQSNQRALRVFFALSIVFVMGTVFAVWIIAETRESDAISESPTSAPDSLPDVPPTADSLREIPAEDTVGGALIEDANAGLESPGDDPQALQEAASTDTPEPGTDSTSNSLPEENQESDPGVKTRQKTAEESGPDTAKTRTNPTKPDPDEELEKRLRGLDRVLE